MATSARGRDPAVEEEFQGALYKGGELLASGKVVEAREHLEKANTLQPKDEKAQNLLGLAYFKLGLYEQASAVYERLVNENPADATLRVNLGLVYLKTNALERCVKEFETATDLEPTHKKAHNYLGLALAQQGQYARAKEHFELAGSDQMAEKMGRALAAQGAASQGAPRTVALTPPASPPPAQAPAAVAPPPLPVAQASDEQPIEVMSDEEPPPDAEVIPEEVVVAAPVAEETAPPVVVGEELPVVDGAVEVLPNEPLQEAPAAVADPTWLTAEASPQEASQAAGAPQSQWVTETVADVPYQAPSPVPQPGGHVAADDPAWSQQQPGEGQWAQQAPQADAQWQAAQQAAAEGWAAQSEGEVALAPQDASGWTTSAEATQGWTAADQEAWAAQQQAALAAQQGEAAGAEAHAEGQPGADSAWATGPEVAAQGELQPGLQAADAAWATGGAGALPAQADDDAWATGGAPATEAPADAQPYDAAAHALATPTQTEDGAWATGGAQATADAQALATQADDDAWATGGAQPEATAAPADAQALPTQADDDSWATGGAQAQPTGEATDAQALQAQPDDASWATGGAQPQAAEAPVEAQAPEGATAADGSWGTGEAQRSELAPRADDEAWAVGPPVAAIAPERAEQIPPPPPSAPLPITVEEPVSAAAMAPVQPPAGYAPMTPQRLGDLGASGAWVREPTAGPFHVSPDGLAVTVDGEMLMRMDGLVAVVGGLEVKPETRRRRGRPTEEPFGQGPRQLNRVSGNGMVYLEPGRSTFHAVDLRDQNGISVDDEGAYLREELVFAFEEPIFFENGRVSGEGQTLELAHLKGNGRVLLQLDGNLRAMPVPTAAPLVVPLQRLVGWFGRVSPRLMGFGGRGAMELTGEGYALLGTPPEKA